MIRSSAYLGNRRIDRRTLLGATMGVAAGAGLRRSSAWAQDDAISGDITYWHHFTSDSEMVGLEQVTALFAEQYPDVTGDLGKHSERRLHDPVHHCRRRRLAPQHHHGRGRPDSGHAGAWRADRSYRAL